MTNEQINLHVDGEKRKTENEKYTNYNGTVQSDKYCSDFAPNLAKPHINLMKKSAQIPGDWQPLHNLWPWSQLWRGSEVQAIRWLTAEKRWIIGLFDQIECIKYNIYVYKVVLATNRNTVNALKVIDTIFSSSCGHANELKCVSGAQGETWKYNAVDKFSPKVDTIDHEPDCFVSLFYFLAFGIAFFGFFVCLKPHWFVSSFHSIKFPSLYCHFYFQWNWLTSLCENFSFYSAVSFRKID
jgi:hypothetical protein